MDKYAIKGSTVHSTIESRIISIEKVSKGLAKTILGYEGQITQLTEDREQCYAMLATKYLPDIQADSVNSTLKEVQASVKKIFQEKQEKRKELEDRMDSLEQDRQKLETELANVTQQLNAKSDRRNELEGAVANELRENPNYVELARQSEKANMRLALYKNRVKEVESIAKEKLPAYKNEKLFTYLLAREYGTPKSRGGRIIQWLDSLVARIVNYSDAKKNYDFLASMPQLMGIEVNKREEELEGILSQVQKMEKASSDRQGLTAVIEEGKKLEEYRTSLFLSVKSIDSDYAAYERARRVLDNEKGEYHKKAIQKLKEYLKGEEISDLKAKARSTKSPEDDQLVDHIKEIDYSIRQLKDYSIEKREKMKGLQTNLDGLKNILRDYESHDYESSRSYFQSGFDINIILDGYLDGRYTVGQVNRTIEENQHFKPRETYRVTINQPTSGDNDSGDFLGSIFSAGNSPSGRSPSSGGGWNFGGGSKHIGGFGGGGSHSIGGFGGGGSRSIGGF